MVLKCSQFKVLEVFFTEPTTIHFIKEISRDIDLAHTSVRKHIRDLVKSGLIKKKKSKPFDGYIANRDEDFFYYKRVYNLYILKEMIEELKSELYPKTIVLFGSYSIGEDTEKSDIDLFMINKSKRNIKLEKYEKKLKRKINLLIVSDLKQLDQNIINKIYNGVVLFGGL